MPRHFAALACALLLAACAHAPAPDDAAIDDALIDLALSRPPAAGERLLLEVDAGVLAAGEEIVLRTLDGQLIGTVSPHGIRSGEAAGTYPVPVPAALLPTMRDGRRLRLRATIERAGRAPVPAHPLRVRATLAPL